MGDYDDAEWILDKIIQNSDVIFDYYYNVCALCGSKGPKLHYMNAIDDVICDKCARMILGL